MRFKRKLIKIPFLVKTGIIGGILAFILTFLIPWLGKLFIGTDLLVDSVIYPSFLICQKFLLYAEARAFCALYISPLFNSVIGVVIGIVIGIVKRK